MSTPPPAIRKAVACAIALVSALCCPGSLWAAAPTDILLSNNTAYEWCPPETVVGILSAVDPDPGDGHLFTLVSGPGGDHNNGAKIVGNELRLRYGFDRDFEVFGDLQFKCRVRATDSTGAFVEKAFVLLMLDDRTEDVDGDGLSEADEEDLHGTSDLVFDSDSDGAGDGSEVMAGVSPTDPSEWPRQVIVGWGDSAGRVRAAPAVGAFVDLTTGEDHSLALRTDGGIDAWGGGGSFGQNEVPGGLTNVVGVSAGGDYWVEDTGYSVVVKDDGSLVFWGCDFDGRLLPPAGLPAVAAVSAGRTHCLALLEDGKVMEWGFLPHEGSAMPGGLGNIVAVAAGGFHSLALRADGTVAAWGSGFDGNEWRAVEVPAGLADVVAVAAGRLHSLALKNDGTVAAWGHNSHGQTDVPPGLSGVVAVAAGGFHSLALKADGSVVAWGLSSHGQTAVPMSAQSGVRKISAGNFHSLALRDEVDFPSIMGPMMVTGEPGVPMSHQIVVEHAIPLGFSAMGLPEGLSIDPVTGLVSGTPEGPARRSVRIEVSTDQGLLSQLLWFGIATGSPPTGIDATPAEVVENSADGSLVAALSAVDPDAGDFHTFELVDGEGADDNRFFRIEGNQLVLGGRLARDYEQDPSALSVRVRARDASLNPFEAVISIALIDDTSEDADGDGLTEAEELVLGSSDSKRDTDGDGFGDGFEAARGTDPVSAVSRPTGRMLIGWGDAGQGRTATQPGVEDFIDLAAGAAHSLAVTSTGLVAGWGSNSDGQAAVPEGLAGVIAASAGEFHSLVLRADGSVVAWGNNDAGQTVVPEGLVGVVEVSAGGYHNLALLSDGTVVAWGDNRYGQCDVPAGLEGVVAVAAGGFHSLALRVDGTVVAWGSDWQGSATVPSGLVGVVQISAGSFHSLALLHDGRVVGWGANDHGQASVPEGLGGVISVIAGSQHSAAVRSDGSLVAWGLNDAGQCDVPAEAIGVRRLAAGGRHTLALRQDAGFPGMVRPPVIRGWPGEDLVFSVPLVNATAADFNALGLPPGVILDPVTGVVTGSAVTGWTRAVRLSAAGDGGVFSTVLWIDTTIGVAPAEITLTPATLLENSPQGTVVGTLSVTDPNAGDSFELSLGYDERGPDDFRFELVGSQLVVRAPLAVDFEAGVSRLTILVKVVDSAGNVTERNLTINLIDDRSENVDGDSYDEQTEEDVLGTSDLVFDDFSRADPDRDGVPSLIEHAFNLNPKVAGLPRTLVPGGDSTEGLPAVTMVDVGGGQKRLRLEYLRRTAGGMVYTPQFGSAPAGSLMQNAANIPTVTPVAPGWERCVVWDSVTYPAAPKRFARVWVNW